MPLIERVKELQAVRRGVEPIISPKLQEVFSRSGIEWLGWTIS